MKEQIIMSANHGDAFFSDNVTVANNQAKFILDFKNTTPRFDPANPEQTEQRTSVVVKHNTVVIDVQMIKTLHTILGDRIKEYEKQFGKIKDAKVNIKNSKIDKEFDKPATVKPNYFG